MLRIATVAPGVALLLLLVLPPVSSPPETQPETPPVSSPTENLSEGPADALEGTAGPLAVYAFADTVVRGTCRPITMTAQLHSHAAGGSPPYTYLWDFGDGGTSQLSDPSHTYFAMVVTYTITLTVNDQETAAASTSFPFITLPPPCPPLAEAGVL